MNDAKSAHPPAKAAGIPGLTQALKDKFSNPDFRALAGYPESDIAELKAFVEALARVKGGRALGRGTVQILDHTPGYNPGWKALGENWVGSVSEVLSRNYERCFRIDPGAVVETPVPAPDPRFRKREVPGPDSAVLRRWVEHYGDGFARILGLRDALAARPTRMPVSIGMTQGASKNFAGATAVVEVDLGLRDDGDDYVLTADTSDRYGALDLHHLPMRPDFAYFVCARTSPGNSLGWEVFATQAPHASTAWIPVRVGFYVDDSAEGLD